MSRHRLDPVHLHHAAQRLSDMSDEACLAAGRALFAQQLVPASCRRDYRHLVQWALTYQGPQYWPQGGDRWLAWEMSAVWGLVAAVGDIDVDEAYRRLKAVAMLQQVATGGALRWRTEMPIMVGIVDYWAVEAAWVAEEWVALQQQISWAVRPMFRASASAADIEAAARRIAGDKLPWPRVVDVLREELAQARGRRRA